MQAPMMETKIATLRRLWTTIGLLAAALFLPLSAYEQGSYLLFDIREDAEAKRTSGRIAVAASVFKIKKMDSAMTQKTKKSEFETEITSFKSDDSDAAATGIEILDGEKDGSKSGSNFGESAPNPGGFFFTY